MNDAETGGTSTEGEVQQPVNTDLAALSANQDVKQVQEGNTEQKTAPEGEQTEGTQQEGTKKPIQPRINELTRQRHEALREAAYWRGIAEGKSSTQGTPAPAAAPAPAKPKVEDYKTYDEFVDALTDWKSDRAVEEALAKVNAKIEERTSQQTAAQKATETSKTWNSRQEEFRTKTPDYDEVVGESDVPISDHLAALIKESEFGPALSYKIAQNPEIAAKLNAMTEMQAAKEFGRLEAAFETPAQPTVKVSKAPTPPNPVPAGRATSKDLGNMSMDEFVATRKAQGAGWANRAGGTKR